MAAMPLTVYAVSAALVFVFSGLLAMAGLGAERAMSRAVEAGAGVGVGGVAGFLGRLLGVGGGNFIFPVLTSLGLHPGDANTPKVSEASRCGVGCSSCSDECKKSAIGFSPLTLRKELLR